MQQRHTASHTRIASVAERRGLMFPLLLGGLLAIWSLGWTALSQQPTDHAEIDLPVVPMKTLVTCEPAGSAKPGVLLRCIVDPVVDRQYGI